MKKSVWRESVKLPAFETLKKDIKTDVLIIGGGLCGILCAHFLKQAGIDCVLAEGDKIALGITGNTTAKITFQHGLIYSKIIKKYGMEKADMYLKANQIAFSEYVKLCKNLNCDFEFRDAYTYSLKSRREIEEEVRSVNELGFDAQFTENTELPFKIQGAIVYKNQAQFNPLKFVKEVSKGLNIYENTFVRELTPNGAITDEGVIRAERIIVATHFPFLNKHGSYFLKLYQHRSYVTAFENSVNLNGMYADENIKGMSFKSYNNLLLVGGGGHRTGKKGTAWNDAEIFSKKYYPNAKVKYRWAAQDCMSLDGIPYIGNYSKNTPDMYVATGFNKWGMTSAMASALILTDNICGKSKDYEEVFSPHRSILKPQLLVNGFEASVNILTPTKKRCPHLGCALKWNKAEHTWDCPCHGSRFEEDGKLIDNPSMGDADIKK